MSDERARRSASSALLAFAVLLLVTGCNGLGFAVAITAEVDSSVDDATLARVTSILLEASGSESYSHDAVLGRAAKRTERLVYEPSLTTRELTIVLTAEDESGAPIASGMSPMLMLDPGKTTDVEIELTADDTSADAGVDLAGSGACDGDCSTDDLPPSPVPKVASDVGYNTLTFDSTTVGTTPGTWQLYDFNHVTQPADATEQNADGSLVLTGNSGDTYNATISTAATNANFEKFQGLAFGGGGYFEVTLTFLGVPDGTKSSPFFWAVDIEHLSGFASTTETGASWVALFPLLTDRASDTERDLAFDNYYYDGSTPAPHTYSTTVEGQDPISFPGGSTFAELHTYAFLWVPATESSMGYLNFYCDGAQVGGSATWNQYKASQPYPPTGADIGNVMDTLHLVLILGSWSTQYSATVTSARVWQASTAHNLAY